MRQQCQQRKWAIAIEGGTHLVEADGDTDDGNNELADEHSEGTVDEEGSSSELFDGVERDRGRAHVDNGEDHRDEERVVNSATSIGRSDVVSYDRSRQMTIKGQLT